MSRGKKKAPVQSEDLLPVNSEVNAPGHTDLMLSPEQIEEDLQSDPLPEAEEPRGEWRRDGGVIVRPHVYEAPTFEDPSEKAWALSSQDREMIHYGVVKMGNSAGEVGACFNITEEVVMKVIEIVAEQERNQ